MKDSIDNRVITDKFLESLNLTKEQYVELTDILNQALGKSRNKELFDPDYHIILPIIKDYLSKINLQWISLKTPSISNI